MWLLRKENRYIYRFVLVGGSAFLLNYFLLRIFHTHLGLDQVASEAISMVVSLQFTFIVHDRWTYELDEARIAYRLSLARRYVSYLFSNSFGSAITIVGFVVLSRYWSSLISLAVAAGLAMIWNFTMNKVLIWRHRGRRPSTELF